LLFKSSKLLLVP